MGNQQYMCEIFTLAAGKGWMLTHIAERFRY
jgi:hypothetical protein